MLMMKWQSLRRGMTIEGRRMRREQGSTAAGLRRTGGEGVATGMERTRG
jgi:hypothetical protein